MFAPARVACCRPPTPPPAVPRSVTGLLEAGGYAAMIWSAKQSGKSNLYAAYVVNQVLVILSPNLLQATDYITLGKVLELTGISRLSRLLRQRTLAAIFIVADLVAMT